ncbi:Cyclic di-GMP phosphodiesterase response regulator RpfG [Lentibacillus sp. JNUCC-1]|uniref:HD-GYP domain-containing protein n=1 Tax=Lentibacillus sp. JNUCC-1 TaxID=2654513 RepID=UPI0012E848DA|nr:HD-GYP domain-containing protein [Lentibacillus sp. JNUCC-1]MUV37956.1 Cyclic di-GMP phosphodiesterase response regulator RpfG [Lentibacillus sp. JNUCC-1]
MRVKVGQIKSGLVLQEDVFGKSGKPIVRKNTVLTDEHVRILHMFQVEAVSIVQGKNIQGRAVQEDSQQVTQPKEPVKQTAVTGASAADMPFEAHYQVVVSGYMKHFKKWQNQLPIDLPALRKLFLPLIERIEDVNHAVYALHHFAARDTYLYHHSVAVGVLASYLGRKMGYSHGEWLQIGLAGLLADSGMAKISPAILKKNTKLNTEEFASVKTHTTQGYYMVEKLPTLSHGVKLGVLQHHERQDGSGYPLGLSGGKVHMYARIIAVCDLYHAMTCERLYREKTSPFKVIELLQREQFNNLDPSVIQAFTSSLFNVTVGTQVILSNNRTAEIVFIDSQHPTKPMVRMEDDDTFIALKDETQLHIHDILG